VVYLKNANLVYTGDIYFGGMYPIIDRVGGGTVNGTLDALHQLLASIDDKTVVIPAHGRLV
jgi:cyclase